MTAFYKYQGTGNDFVIVDNRGLHFPDSNTDYVRSICDRRFGVGADGLMLLEDSKDYDFVMRYYNADGKEGSMCGNGGRCIVAFANMLGIIEKETRFFAVDGVHQAKISGGIVALEMQNLSEIEDLGTALLMDTGSPHYVQKVADVATLELIPLAHAIRYSSRFEEEGTNVNFVSYFESNFKMRTYERGVENETLACGTGATAVALALNYWDAVDSPIKLIVEGGLLEVSFEKKELGYENIWLTGPAEMVFKGELKC
jgi:diaminopimelate epimerase